MGVTISAVSFRTMKPKPRSVCPQGGDYSGMQMRYTWKTGRAELGLRQRKADSGAGAGAGQMPGGMPPAGAMPPAGGMPPLVRYRRPPAIGTEPRRKRVKQRRRHWRRSCRFHGGCQSGRRRLDAIILDEARLGKALWRRHRLQSVLALSLPARRHAETGHHRSRNAVAGPRGGSRRNAALKPLLISHYDLNSLCCCGAEGCRRAG